MKREAHNFIGTVVCADGRVISGVEFLSKMNDFTYENNKSLIDDYAIQADPNYRALEKARRRFVRVEQRREELQAEAERINNELDKITLT